LKAGQVLPGLLIFWRWLTAAGYENQTAGIAVGGGLK
jgi:hypothetical protein